MPLTISPNQRSRLYVIAAAGLLILCAARIGLVLSSAAGVLPLGGDANAYLAAARAILHGEAPIGQNGARFLPEAPVGIPPYFYPPLLALALVPLASLPYPAALYLWLALVLASTVLLAFVLRPLVGWPLALAGVLFFLPTWESLWLGQVNALIAVLVGLMLRLSEREQDWPVGVALALGALLKVTPLLAGLVLLAQRRWRSIGAALLTTLGVVILSLPLVPLDTWYRGAIYALRSDEWSPLFLSWTAILRGQPGLIGTFGPPALIIAMLALTAWRSRAISLRFGLAAASLLALLLPTIIWHYTAILALPALALLWRHSPRARLIALATWALISLVGGICQPLMLTLCWCACCWPQLLGAEEASGR
jgi:hypothetical protein